MTSEWHFPIMIFASILIFFLVMRIVLTGKQFFEKRVQIFILSLVVVVLGMLFGKYGVTLSLPWWVYYTIPMSLTVLLPPVVLKFNRKQIVVYLFLSFLSAPFIHFCFSFFVGWTEYMPFWKIPFIGDI